MAFVGRKPDFTGNGAAAWMGEDKNGKPMITVKLLDSITVRVFKNEEPVEEQTEEPLPTTQA